MLVKLIASCYKDSVVVLACWWTSKAFGWVHLTQVCWYLTFFNWHSAIGDAWVLDRIADIESIIGVKRCPENKTNCLYRCGSPFVCSKVLTWWDPLPMGIFENLTGFWHMPSCIRTNHLVWILAWSVGGPSHRFRSSFYADGWPLCFLMLYDAIWFRRGLIFKVAGGRWMAGISWLRVLCYMMAHDRHTSLVNNLGSL